VIATVGSPSTARTKERSYRSVIDLGSADGERGAKPPRREDRRLSTASELDDLQRRELDEALLEAASFEELPGKWQAAILKAEQNRPKLRLISSA
jgi:hypothetical protein